MQAYYPSFWQGFLIACLKIWLAAGEKVDVVDYSDLTIFDAFNNSYLKVFNDDYLASGK
jgi:hypothetical protein